MLMDKPQWGYWCECWTEDLDRQRGRRFWRRTRRTRRLRLTDGLRSPYARSHPPWIPKPPTRHGIGCTRAASKHGEPSCGLSPAPCPSLRTASASRGRSGRCFSCRSPIAMARGEQRGITGRAAQSDDFTIRAFAQVSAQLGPRCPQLPKLRALRVRHPLSCFHGPAATACSGRRHEPVADRSRWAWLERPPA